MKKHNERDSFSQKAMQAMKAAVRGVIKEHKKTGRPIYIWENGKIKKLSAEEL